MVARGVVVLAALVALAGCRGINPSYDGPVTQTAEGSGETSGSFSSGTGVTSAPGSSGDDGSTGGTGGGTDTSGDSSGGVGSGSTSTSSPGDTSTPDDTSTPGQTSTPGGTSTPSHTSTPGQTSTSTASSGTTSGGVVVDILPQWDTYISQELPDESHGTDDDLRAGSGGMSSTANRLLIRFPVLALQPGCSFSQASLRLYYHADGEPGWQDVDPVLGVYRVTIVWSEFFATWNNKSNGALWPTPGGDFDPAVVDQVTLTGGQYGWVSWDVTDMVMGWCQTTFSNDGLIVLEIPDDGADQGRKLFYSSEYATDPALRPVLRVQ